VIEYLIAPVDVPRLMLWVLAVLAGFKLGDILVWLVLKTHK
jgi:hypothetical protein